MAFRKNLSCIRNTPSKSQPGYQHSAIATFLCTGNVSPEFQNVILRPELIPRKCGECRSQLCATSTESHLATTIIMHINRLPVQAPIQPRLRSKGCHPCHMPETLFRHNSQQAMPLMPCGPTCLADCVAPAGLASPNILSAHSPPPSGKNQTSFSNHGWSNWGSKPHSLPMDRHEHFCCASRTTFAVSGCICGHFEVLTMPRSCTLCDQRRLSANSAPEHKR